VRVAKHDATKRVFAEFTTQFVGNLGKNGAPEDAELGGVGRRRRKESKRDATDETDRAIVGTVA
jgi:hypothetical protein